MNCAIDLDECVSSPCQNGASCDDSTTQPALGGDTYLCGSGGSCAPGYESSPGNQDCSIDIDECASNPCMNGGTCENLVNNYTLSLIPS